MSDDLARSRQTQGTHRRRHDSGLKGDPEYKRMLDKVKRLCVWGEFDQCGCRIRQSTDKSVTVDQESYARKISLITISAHRRKHMSETPPAEEHTTLMAKCGELNWLATQSMIQLLAPLSLIGTSKTATGQSQRCESTRATGFL